jgi:metal transporter CNNM
LRFADEVTLQGPHSGIVYRRAELKELINMHAETDKHGGDLNRDTITIVGATLDLQEKSVKDAMTPMSEVFSLPSDTKLDYETLGRVMKSGHSRVPVYEEISPGEDEKNLARKNGTEVEVKRRIRGVLLTKQLILLDPEGEPLFPDSASPERFCRRADLL